MGRLPRREYGTARRLWIPSRSVPAWGHGRQRQPPFGYAVAGQPYQLRYSAYRRRGCRSQSGCCRRLHTKRICEKDGKEVPWDETARIVEVGNREVVDFERDVYPILDAKCMACHNLAINENQKFSNTTRPFQTLSSSSPILPGAALGNITENISGGNSNYNALWVTGTKHLSHGLQFDASYTWSKSLDYNSRNFQPLTVQNSLDPAGDYGPSDFDARHRFVISPLYELPFKGHRLTEGWRLSGILQLQSGNPLNVTVANSALTGVGNLRPDLLATPVIANQLRSDGNIQWFAPNSVCDPRPKGVCPAGAQFELPTFGVVHFGNMTAGGFKNLDFSISKVTKITERISHELRLETFDLLNHPNFGNPGLSAQVTGNNFGVIRSTRFPTGDSGSARQLQFGMKLIF